MENRFVIYSDGGSRGNPGPAAIGFIIQEHSGQTLFEEGRFIGTTTNNIAEYTAIAQALKKALELKGREVVCYLDSELVVKQINGAYRVKDENIKKYYQQICRLLPLFEKVIFEHVLRNKNKAADRLVNVALDEAHE